MTIKYDKRNYRKHNERNKDLINKSLKECGAGRSIVIDNDNEIIAGNGIYEQAQKIGLKTKIVETDGSELVVVKRTDLSTDDEKRKQLAIMDNSTSDSSDWDILSLKTDFDLDILSEWGLENYYTEIDNQEFVDYEEIMDNENLQEMNTNKCLALSKMPINTYLVIKFDENCTKLDFIDNYAKKLNPKSDIDEKTQFCNYAFMKKDMLEDD